MRAIWVDKDIPRVLLTKAVSPLWPGFVWTPLSAASAGQLPDPPLPGPRWLRVRNQACGICASDLSLLFVHADPSVAPAALPGLSRFYLGHETSSVVTEVGPAVSRFRIGDRVIMDTHFAGANCETLGIEPKCRYCAAGQYQFCVKKSAPGPRGIGGGFGDGFVTHESAVYPAPKELNTTQAALTEPLSVAIHAVMRFPPKPGDKVLVIGAGAIGLLMLLAIRAIQPDAEITVIARYLHQQQMAESFGAKNILSAPGYSEIARLTGGMHFSAPLNKGIVVGGFDVIYDCVGDPRTTTDALRWARAGGAVVLVGVHMAPMPKIDLTLVWYHQVNLMGTYEHGMEQFNGQRKHAFEWVFDFYRQGMFDGVESLVTHRFPFEDYKAAIGVATQKGKERAIKVMFETP